MLAFTKDDFPPLRRALAIFAISVALGIVLVGSSQAILHREQNAMNRAQTERNEARSQHLQAEIARGDILTFQPEFIRLRERGFIGEEARLDWVEQIGRIRDERKLLPISYEFLPRQNFRIDPSIAPGKLELHGSKLILRMDLLHEQDLLDLLADLKNQGFYALQACSIKRTGKADPVPLSPQLSAECSLYRLTLGGWAAASDGG